MKHSQPFNLKSPRPTQPINCLLSLDQEFLETPLTNIAEAFGFIKCLALSGYAFHFEDDPESIINGKTGRALFGPEQTAPLRARISEMYTMDWSTTEYDCPIGCLLYVLEEFKKEVEKIDYA